MRRLTICLVLGILCATAPASGVVGDSDKERPKANPEQAKEWLKKKVPDLKFEKVALKDVNAFLCDVLGVTICFDKAALDAVDVDPAKRLITLDQEGGKTLEQTLDALVTQISTKDNPCGFEACGNVIAISTRQGAKDFVKRHRKALDRAKEEGADALGKSVAELSFDNVAVADVIDFLRDITGAKIEADWAKLEAAGVERNAPVTLHAKDIAFAQVLQLVLDTVGDKHPLSFEVEDGRVTIGLASGEKESSKKPKAPDGL